MAPDGLGTAKVGNGGSDDEHPTIILEGPCATETLAALEDGRRGKPISKHALEGIRRQAAEIIDDIVLAYSTKVAHGEVGAGGTSRATAAPPIAGSCPTGLLYGRVQSGKTAAMIVTTALAVDNGFRIIVVLTSNNLNLVKQTVNRFEDLGGGTLVYSSLEGAGGQYVWDRERDNIVRWMGNRGVVFVCAKEDTHLRALIRFLQAISAVQYPALILDDEADQATPDTTVARRTRGAVPYSSTTYRLVVENDAPEEARLSLRETLIHNVFLQVTATPYGLLLQNLDSPIRPDFPFKLEPGEGYTGGETFFGIVEDNPQPPLCYVSEDESQALREAVERAPQGLIQSIAFFVLSASAHKKLHGRAPAEGYKHLCHTSASRAQHEHLADLIRKYRNELGDNLQRDQRNARDRTEVQWAYRELVRSYPTAPPLEELLPEVERHLPNGKVLVINAQGDELRYGTQYTFLVGGNILSRGLTIDDLLVTYYFRQPKVTQMDTMHQHARMYGYRQGLMPFTRVFLPLSLASRFHHIHETEVALRRILNVEDATRPIPVQVVGDARVSRLSILDATWISAYRPGQQVYPIEPVDDPEKLGNSVKALDDELARLFGGEIERNRFLPISIEDCKKLIRMVVVQDDGGDWDTDSIVQVLSAIAPDVEQQAYLYVRTMTRNVRVLSTGALSGTADSGAGGEQQRARATGRPVLFLIKDGEARPIGKSNPWKASFWYPTVVFPETMPVMVFNLSTP